MITEKKCRVCGVTKPISGFYKHETGKDGYRNHCIECVAKKQKTRALERKAKRRAQKALEDSLKTTRVCTCCGVEYPFDMFHKKEDGKFGISPRCKPCSSEYDKKKRLEDPEKTSCGARHGMVGVLKNTRQDKQSIEKQTKNPGKSTLRNTTVRTKNALMKSQGKTT